ncbi:hypothetical protein ACFWE5_07305 [Cellulosimicrobium funkei]|uniref:hypothetical protein n=1 Tax=Cellulosimicrobium funkei TaxID=264251 RepID=UPI003649A882
MTATADVSPAEARALADAGRERSGERLTDEHRTAFHAAILGFEPGAMFSINDVRTQLDDAGVPPSSRANLFYAATCEGLIELVTLEVGPYKAPYRVRSTGRSAHGAWVNVYARLAPKPADSP